MVMMKILMMMMMHILKYEYKAIRQFQLRLDVVHIQTTEIITYPRMSIHVGIRNEM